MLGPNFQAAQMATIQKTSDAASRTNPRSNPMMVEPNRTRIIKISAVVIVIDFVRTGAFYRRLGGVVVKRASQTSIQGAGATILATCPDDLSFATSCTAAPRSANGPMRTR